METMIESATARKNVDGIIGSRPTQRRAVIGKDVTSSDLSERVHHLKIVIKIIPGCDERDVWPLTKRMLEMWKCIVPE